MDSRITSGEEEGKGGTVGGKFEFAGVETCGEEIGGMLGIGDVDDMVGGDGSGDKDALAVGGKRDVENGVFKGTERGHMDAIVRPQVDLAAVRGGDEIFTIRLNGRGTKGYTLQSMHVMSLCSDGSVGRFRTGPARISVVSTPEESTEMSSQRRMVESPDL